MRMRCEKCWHEKDIYGIDEEVAKDLIAAGSNPKCSQPDDKTKSGRCQGEMVELDIGGE